MEVIGACLGAVDPPVLAVELSDAVLDLVFRADERDPVHGCHHCLLHHLARYLQRKHGGSGQEPRGEEYWCAGGEESAEGEEGAGCRV